MISAQAGTGVVCLHRWSLLSPWELVRKYECTGCATVAMCACDERLGRRVLPHQIDRGVRNGTAERVLVTGGFLPHLCPTCRGEPEPAHPKAEGSNIKRYYWRELHTQQLLRFADWCDAHDIEDVLAAQGPHRAVYEQIEREVLADIKRLHARAPKYTYSELSGHEVLERTGTLVERIEGTYVEGAGKDRALLLDGARMGPEEFARAHYATQGWQSITLESRPIQALFGVLMWMWVQDPADDHGRMVGIRRDTLPNDFHGMTMMTLPDDFGTPEHAHRRAVALDEHLGWIAADDLMWLFEYWLPYSRELTAYLWADDPDVIERARTGIKVMGDATVVEIMRFLAEDYWGRYLGWPDLLLWNSSGWKLVEVKSSRDRLSGAQRSWILANAAGPRLPFHLAKIHRQSTVPMDRQSGDR